MNSKLKLLSFVFKLLTNNLVKNQIVNQESSIQELYQDLIIWWELRKEVISEYTIDDSNRLATAILIIELID